MFWGSIRMRSDEFSWSWVLSRIQSSNSEGGSVDKLCGSVAAVFGRDR